MASLRSVLLPLLLFLVAVAASAEHTCRHDLFAPTPDTLVTGVRLNGGERGGVVKRQVTRDQPIRVSVQYDSSFNNQANTEKTNIVRNDVIPLLLNFLTQALSVPRTTAAIVLDRQCTTNSFLVFGGEKFCSAQCLPSTTCGQITVPEAHLKQCRQCNDGNTMAQCEVIGSDGAGVADTDFILYVSADDNRCPGGFGNAQILAFATSCQLEAELDRPVAGNVHFCPNAFARRSTEFIFEVTKHELLHALGFSASLFPFWRDPSGQPRTMRTAGGQPPIVNNMFQAGPSTIQEVVYTDWQTRTPTPRNHSVTHMVTPRVVAEAREHYGCPSLQGVELENQGGGGTAINHWEKRIFGSEAMTGQFTFNPGFSRMTFALLEDTGWYNVNYSLADPLVWGRNAGCRFALGSCLEWIQTQNTAGQTIAPFCNYLLTNTPSVADPILGCTFDRESISRCNLIQLPASQLPLNEDFLYFNSGPNFASDIASSVGSNVVLTDFCPFHDETTINGRGGTCGNLGNAPPADTSTISNGRLEVYAPGSRCVEHGRRWTVNDQPVTYGSGCYQFECSSSGVVVIVSGQRFSCACEGQEFVLDIINNGNRFQGSIVCPSCAQICHDQLDVCPDPEPATCFGRVEEAIPTVSTATAPTSTPPAGGHGYLALPAVCTLTAALAAAIALSL